MILKTTLPLLAGGEMCAERAAVTVNIYGDVYIDCMDGETQIAITLEQLDELREAAAIEKSATDRRREKALHDSLPLNWQRT